MKIALFTKYGDLAASTRQRFNQYAPFLKAEGIELVPRPLLDDGYLEKLYKGGGRDSIHVAGRYLDRLFWLLSRPDADLIWLHCELFPFLPGLIERFARWPGKPVVFDYDDAIFHNYDQHSTALVRQVLGQKLRSTIGGAELVIAGNAYLANYARPLCRRVEIVPTVVDTSFLHERGQANSVDRLLRVGWIGTPSTWSEYMLNVMPALMPTLEDMDAQLAVMGAGRGAVAQPRLDIEDWSEEAEVPFLQSLDVGIMPLTDSSWARGKCGYKLIQYMACGIPVIASPVGVNAEIVEHGVNGFLVTTETEWTEALRILLSDPALRTRMGREGRRKVERDYSLQVWGPRVAQMLRHIVDQDRRN
jgi:glycosyltransferase involved in cell wall biosynthesis